MSCKDCKERHEGCHSTCEQYINECKEREARKAKIRDKEKAERLWHDYLRLPHLGSLSV